MVNLNTSKYKRCFTELEICSDAVSKCNSWESLLELCKKQYRKLSREYHPDKGHSDDDIKFKTISHAYQILQEFCKENLLSDKCTARYNDNFKLHAAVYEDNIWKISNLAGEVLATKKDQNGDTALHLAIHKNNEDAVDVLLNKFKLSMKENLRIQNNYGHTPLHSAVYNGKITLVNMLLASNNQDINILDKDDNTPLHIAVSNGNTQIVEILLDKQARIDTKNKLDQTTMLLAVENGNLQILNMLLRTQSGQDFIKRKNDDVFKLLHTAMSRFHHIDKDYIEVAKALLAENQSIVDLQYSKTGKTMLHYTMDAIHNGQDKNSTIIEIARARLEGALFLLKNGADPTIKDNAVHSVKQQLQNMTQELSNLRKQRSDVQMLLTEIEKEKAALSAERTKYTEFTNAQQQLKAEKLNLETQNAKFAAQVDTLTQKLSNLEQQNHNLVNQNFALQQELEEQKSHAQRLCIKMKEMEEKNAALSAELNKSAEQLTNAQQQLKVEKLNLETQNAKFAAQVDTLTQKLSNLEQQNHNLVNQNFALQQELEEQKSHAQRLFIKMEEMEEKNAALSAKLNKSAEQLTNAQQQLKAEKMQKNTDSKKQHVVEQVKLVTVITLTAATPLALMHFTMLPILAVTGITVALTLAVGLLVDKISSKLSEISHSNVITPEQQHLYNNLAV